MSRTSLVRFAPVAVALALAAAARPAAQCNYVELKADVATVFQEFGAVIAAQGTRIVVGAPGDKEAGPGHGAAFVFERDPHGAWHQTAKLLPPAGETLVFFGESVALAGDRILVGTSGYSVGASSFGAAYVYELQAGTWTFTARLLASDGASGDAFGKAVALSGDRAFVGAPLENALGPAAGATYLFRRAEDGTWHEIAKVTASDGSADARFGCAIAVDGDRFVVGARLDGELGPDAGAAYCFELDSGGWTETAKLHASDGDDRDEFGASVAIDGELIAVGAPRNDVIEQDAGAAYVFRNVAGNGWIEESELVSAQPGYMDLRGWSVALDGDELAVGVPNEIVFDGFQSGAVHVYRHGPLGWNELSLFVPADGWLFDFFGGGLAFDDGRVAAGATGTDWPGSYQYQAGSVYIAPATAAPALVGCPGVVSLSAPWVGAPHHMVAQLGAEHAGELYLVLGSLAGTNPGLTAGAWNLALNPDAYFQFMLTSPNAGPLVKSLGVLNSKGLTQMAFFAPSTLTSLAGATVHHALVALSVSPSLGITFVTPPTALQFVP